MNDLSKLVITELREAYTVYSESGTKGRRESRTLWAIIYKYEGQTVYSQGERRIVSSPSTPVIIPKGATYDWECIESGHFSVIEFDSDMTDTDIHSFSISRGDKLLREMKETEYKINAKKPLHRLDAMQDTYGVLISLLRSEQKKYLPSDKTALLTPALDHIAKHYTERITNAELSSLTGVSDTYFRKLFTEAMGESPISYVNSLRIKKAKEMLLFDSSTVSDVAKSLGYPSIYDFSRAFKRRVGISPSAFREKEKNG